MFPHDYNCMTVLSSFEILLAEDSVPFLHRRYCTEAPGAGTFRIGGLGKRYTTLGWFTIISGHRATSVGLLFRLLRQNANVGETFS